MNPKIELYMKIMRGVDIEDSLRQQIVNNCARHATLNKIKSGKYKLIAVTKRETLEKI